MRSALAAASLVACGRSQLRVPHHDAAALTDTASDTGTDVPNTVCDWPPMGPAMRLTDPPNDARIGSLAWNGTTLAMAWLRVPTSETGVPFVQRLGTLGERTSAATQLLPEDRFASLETPLSIALTTRGNGAVLAPNRDGACAFVAFDANGNASRVPAILQLASCAGLRADADGFDALSFSVDQVPTELQFAALTPGGIQPVAVEVARLSGDGAETVRFDLGGGETGAGATVNRADGTQEFLYVHLDSGGFPLSQPVSLRTDPSAEGPWPPPVGTLTDRGLLIAWQPPNRFNAPIVVRLVDADGNSIIDSHTTEVSMTTTPGDLSVAFAHGDTLATWIAHDGSGTTPDRVMFRQLDGAGVPRRAAVALSAFEAARRPRIVVTSTGAAIVFEARDATTAGTFQIFSIGLTCLR